MRKGLLTACAGILLVTGCVRQSNSAGPATYPQAAPLDGLSIGGELLQRVMKNFDRLEEEKYRPDSVFMDEHSSNGWPADKEGRTILALTLESRLSNRKALYLDRIVDMIPEHLNERGYFGTIHQGMMNEQQLSGHGWMLRGLCEYYSWKQDPQVLVMIKDIIENLFLPGKGFYSHYPVDPAIRDTNVGAMSGTTQRSVDGWMLSSDIGCVFIGMEGAIHAYEYIPSPELKEIIDEMIDCFLTIDLKHIKAQTHASLTALRGLLRYADLTGDYSLLSEIEKRWALYLTDGMTENHENYNWFDRYDSWTEPCAIVDSYIVAMQLWRLTGKPSYAQDAELIYYNGLSHSQRHNGGFGCDNCPGEHDPLLRIHADEAWWCCTMRGGEGLSCVAQYSCYMSGDTVIVPTYRELSARFPAADGRETVITEKTGYPFDTAVEFTVVEQAGTKTVLKVIVPEWTSSHNVYINDREARKNLREGYLIVDGLKKGDKVRLAFDMEESRKPVINTDHASASQYRLFRGPLQIGESDGQRNYIYHLLDPAVLEAGYAKRVLFSD